MCSVRKVHDKDDENVCEAANDELIRAEQQGQCSWAKVGYKRPTLSAQGNLDFVILQLWLEMTT